MTLNIGGLGAGSTLSTGTARKAETAAAGSDVFQSLVNAAQDEVARGPTKSVGSTKVADSQQAPSSIDYSRYAGIKTAFEVYMKHPSGLPQGWDWGAWCDATGSPDPRNHDNCGNLIGPDGFLVKSPATDTDVNTSTIDPTSGPVGNPVGNGDIAPPIGSSVKMCELGPKNKGVEIILQPGEIGCFPVQLGESPNGYFQVVQHPQTTTSDRIEMWFSTTPGDINDPLRTQEWSNQYGGKGTPGANTYNYTGGPLYWSATEGSPTVCKLEPKPGVTYYINYRHTGSQDAGNAAGCPNFVQWNPT